MPNKKNAQRIIRPEFNKSGKISILKLAVSVCVLMLFIYSLTPESALSKSTLLIKLQYKHPTINPIM
jgi:hypothetical protein